MCPKGVLYIQVVLYNMHWGVSQGCPLYPGCTVLHPLGWVPRVSFISRLYCITCTGVCPKGVLYIQVVLYNMHWGVSQGCPLYPGCTVLHPLRWVPRVSFISRLYCITSTRLGPKGVLYIQVVLYNMHWGVSQGCPLYPGCTVLHPLRWVPRVSFISRLYCITSIRLGPKGVLYIQVLLYNIH